MTEQTPPERPENRYPSAMDATSPLPSQEHVAPAGPQSAPARSRGRAGLVAAVIVGALLAGGAGGVGGAAGYLALNDDAASSGSSTGSGSTGSESTGRGSSGGNAGSSNGSSPRNVAAEGSVQAVAEQVLPSVVMIDVQSSQGSGSGSGVVISEDGQILTNEHVASLAEEGAEMTVSFNDGTTAKAEVLGTDPLTDIAVIKAQDVSGLTPAELGSSKDLRVGQGVVAVGSPFGLDATVTSGIVSALNRPVLFAQGQGGSSTAYPAIQTDAAINPGNSGGPLVDMDGKVVGINASIQTTGSSSPFGGAEGGSIGLGFAIPIDAVMPIAEQLAEGDRPTHARLGVTIDDASQEAGSQGAEVIEVSPGTAAQEAGLESGDIIVKVNDHQITGADALVALVRAYRPGDEVTVTIRRDGEEQTIELTLGSDARTS